MSSESFKRYDQSSFVKKESFRESCDFCAIPQTKTTENFRALHGELPHTLNLPGVPLAWTVLQDVVPIAENGGHLLLIPNKHRISLASVEEADQLAIAKQEIVKSLRKFFPHQIFFFEHGSGFIETEQIACGGCHLDHAHGHFLLMPEGTDLSLIQQNLEKTLEAAGWKHPGSNAVAQNSAFENLTQVAGMNPYLHIGIINDGELTSFTYIQRSLDEKVESQLLRRIISDVVYHQPASHHWHWRDITEGLAPDNKLKEIKDNVLSFRQITGF